MIVKECFDLLVCTNEKDQVYVCEKRVQVKDIYLVTKLKIRYLYSLAPVNSKVLKKYFKQRSSRAAIITMQGKISKKPDLELIS